MSNNNINGMYNSDIEFQSGTDGPSIINTHNDLAGRSETGSHPASAIYNDPISSIGTSTNVQNTLVDVGSILQTLSDDKVDKIAGKGLSTEDFTTAEKNKLATVDPNAEENAVNSVNGQVGTVQLDADDITDTSTVNKFTTQADINKLAGIEFNATADQTKADIDALGIDSATVNGLTVETAVPSGAVFTDTTYNQATISVPGLVEKATSTEAEAGTPDKFPDAAGVHDAFNQYGLGTTTSIQNIDDLDGLDINGFFRADPPALNLPLDDNVNLLNMAASSTTNSQLAISWDPYDVRAFLRAQGTLYTDWVEILHTGNINRNKFGGTKSTEHLGYGVVVNATTVAFDLHINSYDIPTSITTTGTFEIKSHTGVSIRAAIPSTDVILSSQSGGRVVRILIENNTGLTPGEAVQIISETSSSYIEVDF